MLPQKLAEWKAPEAPKTMTPEEKRQVQHALALISVKYQEYIKPNQWTSTLLTDPAKIIKFYAGPQYYLESGSVQSTLGCKERGCTKTVIGQLPKVFINRTHAVPSTIVHELFHFFTHPNFLMRFGKNDAIVEGMTEYFTRKTLGRAGTNPVFKDFDPDRTGSYDDEHQDVLGARNMVRAVIPKDQRKDFAKRAYFSGDAAAIQLIADSMQ